MKNKICAIIITYNIDKKIVEVINAIINQIETIIIVDNASNDKTIKILKELSCNEKVNVIFNNENVGIATALNQGIKFAENNNCNWVLTLDHDSICGKDMIHNMMLCANTYNQYESIGMLAPKAFDVNKKEFISKKNKNNAEYIEIKDCIQSGSLIKVDVFKKIGYFNEELFIYHVDFDFCQRMLKAEFRILQCNNSILYHEEGYKVPKNILWKTFYYNNYSSYAIYYITRNTIYMCKKYNIIYIKRIVKDFVHILLFDKKRYEKISYWARGIKDAVLNNYGKLKE